jgi:multidrug efflux system membrane fusion protein
MNDVASPIAPAEPALREPGRRSLGRLNLVSTLIVLACLVAVAAGGWFLAHHSAAGGPGGAGGAGANRARTAATVAFAPVVRADIPITLDALGTVTPIATVTVRPQVSGVIAQILYHEGQMVEVGQPLAQIDPRPFQLALDMAQGNLTRDEALLDNARVTLERDQTLLGQDSIAQQDVDTQAATVKQYQGIVATDRANLGTARLNLSYARIVSPIAGRVGLRTVDVGNYVSTGDTTGIATLTQLKPIDVVFTIPGDAVGRVQQRVATGASLPTTVLDRTRTVTLGQGTFLTLDNQVDTQTGTVRAKARFVNVAATLFPNQFVNARLLLDTLHDALVVPAAAVRHGPTGDFVFVITPQHTASVRPVKVGPSTADLVAIESGVELNEQVVTEGGDRLTDGGPVRLPGARPPGAAGGKAATSRKRGTRGAPQQ